MRAEARGLNLGRTSWHYDEVRRAAAARPPQARRCARVGEKVAGRAMPDFSKVRPLRRVPAALRSHTLRAASRRHCPRRRLEPVASRRTNGTLAHHRICQLAAARQQLIYSGLYSKQRRSARRAVRSAAHATPRAVGRAQRTSAASRVASRLARERRHHVRAAAAAAETSRGDVR